MLIGTNGQSGLQHKREGEARTLRSSNKLLRHKADLDKLIGTSISNRCAGPAVSGNRAAVITELAFVSVHIDWQAKPAIPPLPNEGRQPGVHSPRLEAHTTFERGQGPGKVYTQMMLFIRAAR